MGLPLARGHDDIGGTAGGGYLCLMYPEHSHTVYYYQAHFGPVSGSEAEAWVKDGQAVMCVSVLWSLEQGGIPKL